jgi:hypothetical protein
LFPTQLSYISSPLRIPTSTITLFACFFASIVDLPNSRFFLATDERDPDNLDYLSEQGAILTSDLLTIEDRRAFGWPIMVTDVLGLVEQAILAQASYFYGHVISSFAGGTINMRGAAGLDPRTTEID